jgi:hypothetical protein
MGPIINEKKKKKKKRVRDVVWSISLLDSSGCFVHSRVRDDQREKGTPQQHADVSQQQADRISIVLQMYTAKENNVQIWNPEILLYSLALS